MRVSTSILATLVLWIPPASLMASGALYESESITVWRAPEKWNKGGKSRNVTAIRMYGKVALVDPGVIWWYEDLTRQFPRIDEVWITHAHPDHAAIAPVLRDSFQCRVLCSERASVILGDPDSFLDTEFAAAGGFVDDVFPPLLRPFAKAFAKLSYGRWPPTSVDATFEAVGMRRGRVVVKHLPGHTPGSVGFFLEDGGKRTAVLGDIVQLGNPREFVLSINLPRADLGDCFDSVMAVRDYRPDVLIAAHGAVAEGSEFIQTGLEGMVSRYRAYLGRVEEYVTRLGFIPVLSEIDTQVPFEWPDGYRAHFTQRRSLVLAALRYLHAQARISEDVEGVELIGR